MAQTRQWCFDRANEFNSSSIGRLDSCRRAQIAGGIDLQHAQTGETGLLEAQTRWAGDLWREVALSFAANSLKPPDIIELRKLFLHGMANNLTAAGFLGVAAGDSVRGLAEPVFDAMSG
jgi:hypothetical protein